MIRPAVLIPSYQCAATIAEVVAAALRHLDVAVVVDDGSTDDTAACARSAGAEVIGHDRNRGRRSHYRKILDTLRIIRAVTLLMWRR